MVVLRLDDVAFIFVSKNSLVERLIVARISNERRNANVLLRSAIISRMYAGPLAKSYHDVVTLGSSVLYFI